MPAPAPRQPLAPVLGASGQPVGFVTAQADGSPDPLLAQIMAQYVAREAAAHAHREAIRQGLAPKPEPLTVWHISDRD